jgi:hypothetical protein
LQRQIRLAEDIIGFALKKEMIYPVKFVKSTFHPLFDPADLEKHAKESPRE